MSTILKSTTFSIQSATTYLNSYDKDLLSSSDSTNPIIFLQSDVGKQYNRENLRSAILTLSHNSDRAMLGICSSSATDAVQALKTWVPALGLPKGLLLGLDVGGVPVDTALWNGAYVKYSTGGSSTFEQVRKSGVGFESLWKPGDAFVEDYDGKYRGVYFTPECDDGAFRQYGVLPEDLWVT